MINANELRIGNLVLNVFDNPLIVASINPYYSLANPVEGINSRSVDGLPLGFSPFDKIKPIKLTEKWLLNMGFKKEFNNGMPSGHTYWEGDKIDLTNDLELSTSSHMYASISVTGSIQFKYVHQLQNIYKALTNEELNIKLK